MTPVRTRRQRNTPDADTGVTTDDSTETGQETDAESVNDELEQLSHLMPDGAMLTLWRLVDGGDKEFIDEQPVAEFSIPSVRERFGGGRYIMFLRTPDPKHAGKYFRAGSRRFRVGGPPRYNVPDVAAGGVAPSGGKAAEEMARSYGELVQQQIKQSLENQQLMQSMQLALLRSMTETRTSPTDDLTKTLITALLNRKSDQQLTIGDVVTIADKMANRTSPVQQMKEMATVFESFKALTGDGDGGTWQSIAGKGLDTIARAIESGKQNVDVTPAQLPATTGNPPPDAAPDAPEIPDTMHPVFKHFAQRMPMLLRHAVADHEPATYAGVLFDEIPPEFYTPLLGVLDDGGFMAQLVATFPAIGTTMSVTNEPVRAWFEELRSELVDCIREALGMPVTTDGEGPELVQ